MPARHRHMAIYWTATREQSTASDPTPRRRLSLAAYLTRKGLAGVQMMWFNATHAYTCKPAERDSVTQRGRS